MNYNTIRLLVLLLIHTLSVNIYFLIDTEAYQKDIIFLISSFVILLNIKYIKIVFTREDKYIYLFAIYAVLSTCFMSAFNFGQPFIYSLLASRLLLIIVVMYISLNFLLKGINLKSLYKVAYVVSIFLVLFSFYLYFSKNLSILYIDTTYAYRLGAIRLTIAPMTLITMLLFFYFHTKQNSLSYIPFIGLISMLVVIDKTRSSLIAVILILLIFSINLKDKKNFKKLYIFFLIVVLSIIFTNFESSIFQPFINMYEHTQNEVASGSGNVNVRAMEFAYFLKFLDIPSMIFGYGMDNHAYKYLYYSKFYLSDLGIFKVFYLHGIIGLLLFIGIYYQMYKQAMKSNTPLHQTGKALVLVQIFAPTLNITYHLEGIFLFFVIYILIKQYNIRNNLNG